MTNDHNLLVDSALFNLDLAAASRIFNGHNAHSLAKAVNKVMSIDNLRTELWPNPQRHDINSVDYSEIFKMGCLSGWGGVKAGHHPSRRRPALHTV